MNSEDINQTLIETTIQTMKAMADLAADTTQPVDSRIKAAAAVSGMGDSIVKGNLFGDYVKSDDKTKKKIANSLDRLIDKHDHED